MSLDDSSPFFVEPVRFNPCQCLLWPWRLALLAVGLLALDIQPLARLPTTCCGARLKLRWRRRFVKAESLVVFAGFSTGTVKLARSRRSNVVSALVLRPLPRTPCQCASCLAALALALRQCLLLTRPSWWNARRRPRYSTLSITLQLHYQAAVAMGLKGWSSSNSKHMASNMATSKKRRTEQSCTAC